MIINDDAGLRRILETCRTIAVVGLSSKPHRASFIVADYLQRHGYTIVPVTPKESEILGARCYPTLRDIPFAVDMVDVFRNATEVPPIAEDAIAIGAKALWLQLGVINEEAASRAAAAGLDVVMDRCPKIDHGRLIG